MDGTQPAFRLRNARQRSLRGYIVSGFGAIGHSPISPRELRTDHAALPSPPRGLTRRDKSAGARPYGDYVVNVEGSRVDIVPMADLVEELHVEFVQGPIGDQFASLAPYV